MNSIILKKNFSIMNTRILFYLFFYLLATLLTNSIVILEKNGNFLPSLGQSKSTYTSKTFILNADNSLNENNLNGIGKYGRLLQTKFQQIPTNQPSDGLNSQISDSKIKNLNLDQIQRPLNGIPFHFPGEDDIVQTSDLHIFSSLGIESGSKIMTYIKSKIEGNRKLIFEHNYSRKKSYMLAENKFIIYTVQQFREMYLTLKEPSAKNLIQSQQIQVISPKSNLRRLQTSTITVNWKTARKMTSVKFQQTCGACYSFTTIGAIESAYMISKNVTLNLAEQQVVDCSTPYDNYGCVGGWNANAYKYIRDFGVLFESDYPYRADFGSCTISSNSVKYRIQSYVQLANDCSVVIQALKNQPLSIAVNSEGWMYYSSGIYTDCKVGGSNHGVVLAGVDSTSWLIKNSWGFTWGQSGYMRIGKDAPNNACNVCQWASYPVI